MGAKLGLYPLLLLFLVLLPLPIIIFHRFLGVHPSQLYSGVCLKVVGWWIITEKGPWPIEGRCEARGEIEA